MSRCINDCSGTNSASVVLPFMVSDDAKWMHIESPRMRNLRKRL